MHLIVPNSRDGISKKDLKSAWDREIQHCCAMAIEIFRDTHNRPPSAEEIVMIAEEVIKNLKNQDVDLTILQA